MPCFSKSLVFQKRNLWGQTTVRYAHNINVLTEGLLKLDCECGGLINRAIRRGTVVLSQSLASTSEE